MLTSRSVKTDSDYCSLRVNLMATFDPFFCSLENGGSAVFEMMMVFVSLFFLVSLFSPKLILIDTSPENLYNY